MIDALLSLQPQVTKTAAFQGTPLVMPAGTPRRGLKARIIYSAASVASGTGTAQFGLDISYDGGVTWQTGKFQSDILALSTTAAAGEIFIPFDVSPWTVANGVQVRPSLETITGTTPTITYQMDLTLGRP